MIFYFISIDLLGAARFGARGYLKLSFTHEIFQRIDYSH